MLMLKEPLHHNSLGEGLHRIRVQRQLTQRFLAHHAGISVPTIRGLEQGHGRLSSLWQVLTTLEVTLDGRNLSVGGRHVGRRIVALRQRRGFSQRTLAALTSVTQPTIIALERHATGRLATLDRVLSSLGAGAYLRPRLDRRPFFTHAGNSSVHHGWETPPALLERLYGVFGIFDLDPCADDGRRVKALVHFTPQDDGLSLPWHGRVFINPPYGRQLGKWVAKARREVEAGHALSVVALLPARTDTRWWHDHIAGRAEVWMLRGRLKFGDGRQAAPFPSAIVLWGVGDETRRRVQEVFAAHAWHIPCSHAPENGRAE